ncbi:MAG TPA: hypothetical protein DEP72_02565, partial [Clostridiales bacterium]|nr:hypothetical protein [Clostridiales bacterium]
MILKDTYKIIIFFLFITLFLGNTTVFAATPTTVTQLMSVIKEEGKKSVYNVNLNAPFSKSTSGIRESIDVETGEVRVQNQIFDIPGRNGQDLNIALEYRSRDAKIYEEATKSTAVTNNYGQTIIAYYDVFNANGYWLRTGGLIYATTETTILATTIINGENWVFSGYLQYQTGTSIISSTAIANFAREKSEVQAAKEIFGQGWKLSIPYLDVDTDNVYVQLQNGETYKADFTLGCGLKDYELTDVTFTKNTTVTSGSDTSAYKLYYISGNAYYFTANGELILEADKYGNKVQYTWETVNGLRRVKQVTDSIGHSVNISYNNTGTVFTSGSRTVTLGKTLIPGYTNKYYMSSFTDALGRVFNYNYSLSTANFDLLGKTSATNTYANLYEIVYPTGAKTQYQYTKSTKNLGISGFMDYFKVTERADLLDGVKNSTIKYQYAGDPDGYPTYKPSSIVSTYSYYTKVIDTDGVTTKHTYNYKHQENLTEIYTSAGNISTTNITYHGTNHMPTNVDTKTYGKDGNYKEKLDTYTYDSKGNVTQENHPIDPTRVYSTEYTTYYTYDTTYNLMTSKKYKKDANTTIEIKSDLTTDKKEVAKHTAYSNGSELSSQTFSYDPYGNVVTVSRKKDATTWTTDTYEYGSQYTNAYLTKVTSKNILDADGKATTININYTYDLNTGNKVSDTDGNGNKATYTYDNLDRILKETMPDGNYSTYVYNDPSNILTTTDPNGTSLVYTYDKLGKLLKVAEPSKNTTLASMSYDTNERLLTQLDGNNNTKNFIYDNQSRIVEVNTKDSTSEILSQTQVTYPTATQITATNKGDTKDKVANYYFDNFDRLVKLGRVDADNENAEQTSAFDYDYLSNQVKATNFAGEVVTYEYDGASRVVKTTDNVGNASTFSYDNLGDMISQTNSLGQTSYSEYDSVGRKIKEKKPYKDDQYATAMIYYDNVGNVVKAADPDGYETKNYYNNRNLLIAVEKVANDKSSYITKVEYDKSGNMTRVLTGLTSMTDPNYSQTTYKYDILGRMNSMIDNTGKSTTYQYDNNGNVLNSTDRNGVVSSFTYDGLDRLLGKTNSKDGTKTSATYAYDKLGNIMSVTVGGSTIDSLDKGFRTGDMTRTYKYDNFSRLTKVDYSNGTAKTYTYDTADRVTKFALTKGSANEIHLSYKYDNIGRLVNVNDKGKNLTSYTYDSIGRLTEETNNITGIKSDYRYYSSGNLQSLIHYNGEDIENAYTYQYNRSGNRTQKVDGGEQTDYVYDSLGRLKTTNKADTSENYEYDNLNNIKKKVETKGNNIFETDYTYDLNNRLISKQTDMGKDKSEILMTYDPEGNMLNKT